jgi:hypothetical protein
MVKDAELHAEEDRRKKEELEIRNRADSLLNNAEKTLADADGKVAPDLIATARDAAASLRQALDGTDAEAVRVRTDGLTEAVYAVSSALYQASRPATAPGPLRAMAMRAARTITQTAQMAQAAVPATATTRRAIAPPPLPAVRAWTTSRPALPPANGPAVRMMRWSRASSAKSGNAVDHRHAGGASKRAGQASPLRTT